jgi:hypothetical protein
MRARHLCSWVFCLLMLGLLTTVQLGCATYSNDLERGVKYYQSNDHEKALAIFRTIEPDVDSLKPGDRVRYYYFRGMADYRLASKNYKVRPDARHWLAMAQSKEKELPDALSEEEKKRLKDALKDLNRDVFGGAGDSGAKDDADSKDKSDDKKDDKKDEKKSDDDSKGSETKDKDKDKDNSGDDKK